jgi:hypothetical protein
MAGVPSPEAYTVEWTVSGSGVAPRWDDQPVRRNRPLTGRDALVALALFWTVGACLLVASWRSAVAEDRVREAPTCSESQLFTATECRITLDGTMTSLTSDRAEMDVGGRHVSATVTISGTIPDMSGVPVRVTLYRGKPMHIEGQDLKIDTDDAPARSYTDFRNVGMFFLIGGALLVGANVLIGSIGRRRATPR